MKTVLNILMLLLLTGAQTVFMTSWAGAPPVSEKARCVCSNCACGACICEAGSAPQPNPITTPSRIPQAKLQCLLPGIHPAVAPQSSHDGLGLTPLSSFLASIGLPLYLRDCAQLI